VKVTEKFVLVFYFILLHNLNLAAMPWWEKKLVTHQESALTGSCHRAHSCQQYWHVIDFSQDVGWR